MLLVGTKLCSLCIVFLAATGCATVRHDLQVTDSAGIALYRRTLEAEDLQLVLDEQYSMFAQARPENCRALSLIVGRVWPENDEAFRESRRLAAWATLFLYRAELADLTSLQNEKRNLLILASASVQFSNLDGVWAREAVVANRAIELRLINYRAFEEFIRALKHSSVNFASDGGISDRETAVETIERTHPAWSGSVGVKLLASFPWRPVQQ